MTRRRWHPPLAPEDLALWERVKREVTPLEPPGPRRTGLGVAGAEPVRPPEAEPEPDAEPPKPPPPGQPTPPAPKPKPPLADRPELQPLDRRLARRLRSGRADVEARLDLHGLNQERAHGELMAFLRRAQAQGLRFVLVITGKGGRAGEGTGVLRRSVPLWLAAPACRSLVVASEPAGPVHGGEGAFYVQVRRPRAP